MVYNLFFYGILDIQRHPQFTDGHAALDEVSTKHLSR
jgi:hypothetical protein